MGTFTEALRKQREKVRAEREVTSKRAKEILLILKNHDIIDEVTPQKVVSVLEDLGPTFVKLGQIASTHTDMLPPEYCDALGSLRSSVAPMDASTTRTQIETQLGKPVDELFASFDDAPLGSASIGQVHRAELADGTVVAVKVQRPGVAETVAEDFSLLERLMDMSEKMGSSDSSTSLREIVQELERTSKEELDFTNEARNLERFWQNNDGRDGVKSPKCYLDYTNEAILTEDFVSGPEAGDEEYVASLDDDERERLGNLVADNYAAQVLVDGFYHADPHAGNVLLVDGGIEWIDFGMMGTLTSKERQVLIDLVTAIVKRDSYGLKRGVLQVATPRGAIDHGALLDMCERMVDEYADTDLEGFDTGKLVNELTDNLKQSGFDIDPFLTNLGRGLVTIEGTIKALSPRINIMECFTRYINTGFDPDSIERQVRNLVMKGMQGVDDLAGLPTKAVETLDMLQKSQLKVGGNFGAEQNTLDTATSTVNNFTLTLMAAALFLGSCILCLTGMEPQIAGVPALGFCGFVAGICLMVHVFLRIRKS